MIGVLRRLALPGAALALAAASAWAGFVSGERQGARRGGPGYRSGYLDGYSTMAGRHQAAMSGVQDVSELLRGQAAAVIPRMRGRHG